MSAKNNNYYPLNVFNSFSKDKFYQDSNMSNYMIDKKGMFKPKKFDIYTFVFLSIFSACLTVAIGGISFFIILPFSNSESAAVITSMIMEYLLIISFMFILYFSFVLITDCSSEYDNANLLSFLVKKKNTSYFGQKEYDLVEKHCPSELDKWVSAIIDYGESTSHEAKTYADNIVKISQKRKDKAEKEKDRNIDEQWIHDRILSDALLDFE